MYNIGICDDGENICESMNKMLAQYGQERNIRFDISMWYTGEELRDYLAKGGLLDVLFLDIELFCKGSDPAQICDPGRNADRTCDPEPTGEDCVKKDKGSDKEIDKEIDKESDKGTDEKSDKERMEVQQLESGSELQRNHDTKPEMGMTGIEVGGYIRKQLENMGMQIVYISGKASYAQQLFKTQPLDFLVKPISQQQVNDVMDLAVKIIKKRSEKFEFRRGKDYYYIPMGDIIYLGSDGRKVRVITKKATFEYYGRLKEAAKQLSEDFIMIHYSFIINKGHVKRYAYETVELQDGTILTISPSKRKFVREKILKDRYA